MRNQLRFDRSFVDKLAVFFLFSGILTGTVWVNLKEPNPVFSFPLLVSVSAVQTGGEVFLSFLFKRLFLLGFLWMLGLSKLALPGIFLFFFWSGVSMSFVLAELTLQCGLSGLFLFLVTMLPQQFFYVPVFLVLSSWALKGNETFHLPGMTVLFFLTLMGAAAEAYGNPRFLQWVTAWLF